MTTVLGYARTWGRCDSFGGVPYDAGSSGEMERAGGRGWLSDDEFVQLLARSDGWA
jgi:hypothetical protein